MAMDRLAKRKEHTDAYIGSMSIIGINPILDKLREDEALKLRVHQMCEEAWGKDPLWYIEETWPDCKYSIEVNDEEITIWDFINGGSRTFARESIDDPDLDLAGIFDRPDSDRVMKPVWEGGYPDTEKWSAIDWIRVRLNHQLEFIDSANTSNDIRNKERIDVQPTMFGYSIQLDELDLIYNVTHEEVLDEHFSPIWIVDHLLAARNIPAENRGDRFEDKRFTKYVMIMLGMT